ncbi:PhzF family phenazine biosynthesis protein [Xanthobacter tagetidis]|uniref:PhzF family phenazine biosynthesis protein n=1 Tax=Xanthobacter tagetidis TaxID=60216 RepID=A0A3L7AG88_9HYPH|nr:PhzF family phenazine biosynthesis protein [Xanthobacter tagetidis]MBB6308560.1 trans-2,3-dihydro-3-hydroxyanthranilate isomerase [Xanthobacter tagetidis]RLP78671.1 PhzF family phenazine biosynthesis protein [Xanthobacter tagetidis]
MPASEDLSYVLVDVFTDTPFGGNPLAVFTKAEGLSDGEMQAIARELNLSETTFVSPPPAGEEGYSVRIFTPLSELPFAGHPTIGTALVLHALVGGTRIVLHETIGPVPVRILASAGAPRAVLSSPKMPERIADAPPASLLARLLGLAPDDVLDGAVTPACCSGGVPFTFIPVRDRAALARIRLDGALWQAQIAQGPAPHLYALAMEDWGAGTDICARMFAPSMGIAEDPATGVAAVALAAYLAGLRTLAEGEARFAIRQGEDMGRPSLVELTVDVSGGRISGVHVGGGAVRIGGGALSRAALARRAG